MLKSIQLVDVNGKIIREEKVGTSAENYSLDIHDLIPGIFTLRVFDEEGNESSTRIIKQ